MITDLPANMVPPLAGSVGYLVLNWAIIETCLDYNTAIIFQAAGGRHIDREIPQALTRKIGFLRRCFKRIDALQSFSAEALGYLDKAKKLSATRHLIVHGVVSKYDESTEQFLFIKMDLINGRTLHRAQESWIAGRQLIDDGVECEVLARDLLAFTNRLLQTLVPENEGHELIR